VKDGCCVWLQMDGSSSLSHCVSGPVSLAVSGRRETVQVHVNAVSLLSSLFTSVFIL